MQKKEFDIIIRVRETEFPGVQDVQSIYPKGADVATCLGAVNAAFERLNKRIVVYAKSRGKLTPADVAKLKIGDLDNIKLPV